MKRCALVLACLVCLAGTAYGQPVSAGDEIDAIIAEVEELQAMYREGTATSAVRQAWEANFVLVKDAFLRAVADREVPPAPAALMEKGFARLGEAGGSVGSAEYNEEYYEGIMAYGMPDRAEGRKDDAEKDMQAAAAELETALGYFRQARQAMQ